MLFYDSSTYGKDIMASSTGHIQIGKNATDTTTIMGDLIIQEPTDANHAATRRYADRVSLMATALDTRLPLYGNKHSLNLSSASTNNEFAFGLKKPVLFVDTPRKIKNIDYDKIGMEERITKILELFSAAYSPEKKCTK